MIAVVRAETYYTPPHTMPRDAWAGVPGAELVYRWIVYRLGRRPPLPDGPVPDVPPVYARVDHNRWLAECVCGSAAVVSPVDPRWGCTECGYGWITMILPSAEEVPVIEAALMAIPQPHLRMWWHPDDPANPNPPVPAGPGPVVP
ncbi:hypothetical protein [Streptomyces uncialis]|uniref:hypothetical protein n=1 Tax=Streptomyces uncialis TaxID=1048205 RepID=UPI0033E689E7